MRAEHWRHLPLAHWLLLATLVLLPFGMASELAVLAGAVLGGFSLIRRQIDWQRPGVKLALVLGAAYWLPQLFSAFDSVSPSKSWSEAVLDLRFLLFLLYVANTRCGARDTKFLGGGIAAIVVFWCLDALLQAATGYSLGGLATSDRLSGIFGADNLKLGGVLAALAPFALSESWHRGGRLALATVTVVLLVVILLAGARAAWFGFALGAALSFWHILGRRRAVTALLALSLAALLSGIIGYSLSERFAQRVDRTAAVLSGDYAALDHALAGRLAIWETAWRMGEAHPVNGVGVRAFRYAYPEFAAPDDPFVDTDGTHGALHAHQIVLELWSETGSIGLGLWLAALFIAWHIARHMPKTSRMMAQPASIALVVALFPLNTHYAVYSAFWGLLLMWLAAIWLILPGGQSGQAEDSIGTNGQSARCRQR
ncbi:O-antigen ligase family protein [Xanthomonadaceae bacterium JHOS43]|nr:O-antigen ligase family protein [Xanthomonadaceae bacterium JHOS43]MCX7562141.1 O-antigen ligase family protein [Xanthomonadaceae bacterium XH05]